MDVKNVTAYSPASYPSIGTPGAVYFTNEFRNLQRVIKTLTQFVQSATAGVTTKAGVPVAADLAPGTSGLFKDTTGGGVYLAYNDAGTLKKIALT